MLNEMKIRFMRSLVRLPNESHSSEYTVKCVSTLEEFKGALNLLHDCYVQKGLMKPQPSRMRLMPHHLLPETNIMIVLHEGKIVATGSVVHRGLIKLPSYSAFSEKFSYYTANEVDSHEFSALAVDYNYRKKKNLMQIFLSKYYLHLLNKIYNNPYLLCAVHPKAKDFYKLFFNLDHDENIVSHESVDGAAALFVRGDVSLETIGKLSEYFHGNDEHSNFAKFIIADDKRFNFPNISKAVFFDPNYYYVLTQEIYPYLLKNGILSIDQFKKIMNQVCHFMPIGDNVSYFESDRPYRSRSSLLVKDNENHEIGQIDNMSFNGLLIRLKKDVRLSSPNGILKLNTEWENKKFEFESKIIRLDLSGKLPSVGLQLLHSNPLIVELTKDLEMNLKNKKAS